MSTRESWSTLTSRDRGWRGTCAHQGPARIVTVTGGMGLCLHKSPVEKPLVSILFEASKEHPEGMSSFIVTRAIRAGDTDVGRLKHRRDS